MLLYVSAFLLFSRSIFEKTVIMGKNKNTRASFGGKLSVILVAAGSAIGLGALWRFPYVAGENGGAAFLLVFLLSVLVVGIPAMLAEFAVGRRTNKNAVGAFRSLSKRWSWLGYSGVLGALLISGYYYLIAGWSLEYFVNSRNFSGSKYYRIDFTVLHRRSNHYNFSTACNFSRDCVHKHR